MSPTIVSEEVKQERARKAVETRRANKARKKEESRARQGQ